MSTPDNNIFVQIPSYKDTQLVSTVRDLLENAYIPNRLKICICFQHGSSEKLPKWITRKKNIKIIDIHFKDSKGVNWARSILQKEWDNESYSFLIDSHMRFVKNWDEKLIRMMKALKRKGIAKPIISCLPPPFYNPNTFPADRMNYPLKTYPKEYAFNLLTRFHGYPIPLYKWIKQPIPAEFLSLGFLFTEGSFNLEIPFDPNIYFFGDDITTTLRAYSYGYDFFHPHRIIAWHLYDRTTRTPHWDDHVDWFELDMRSYERVQRILMGENFDSYSRGISRVIQSFEDFIGYKLIRNEQN
jgi:hypothetical protein